MKQAQIAIYVVLGLVIFLVFLGLLNLIVDIVPASKIISGQDVKVFINSCLDASFKCALYTAGLEINKDKTIETIKTENSNYVTKSLNLCLGDLSKKFKGNKFNFTETKPDILFSEETTAASIKYLGEMRNGNARVTFDDFATKAQVAMSKILDLVQTLQKQGSQKEKKIELLDKRFKLNIYQLNDDKEAVIVEDSRSKLNDKNFNALFVG